MAMTRTRIKFCGMQSADDVRLSEAIGVDAVGFILAPSPRQISLERAAELAHYLSPLTTIVAVVVNPLIPDVAALRAALPRAVMQFCGDETAATCAQLAGGLPYFKALSGRALYAQAGEAAAEDAFPAPAMLLLDSSAGEMRGGTGIPLAWADLRKPKRPYFLAGGLHADNVAAAIGILRPYGVDVRSGIESDGRKDEQKMRAFAAAVRRADEEISHGT